MCSELVADNPTALVPFTEWRGVHRCPAFTAVSAVSARRARLPSDRHMSGTKDVAGRAPDRRGLNRALLGLDEFVGWDDSAVDRVQLADHPVSMA